MELNDVRNRLSRIMNDEDISGNSLSLEIDRSMSYINKFISGKNDITMKSFLNICKALNIEPKDFFSFDISYPGKAGRIFEEVKKLNSKQNLELLDKWAMDLLELEAKTLSEKKTNTAEEGDRKKD